MSMDTNINDVLEITEFESGLAPTKQFPIHADKVGLDKSVFHNVVLYASYDRHFDLVVKCPAAQESGAFIDQFTATNSPMVHLPERTEFIRTMPCTLPNGEVGIEMVASKEPFLIGPSNKTATSADIIVVNGLEFYISGQTLEFNDGDYRFQFK